MELQRLIATHDAAQVDPEALAEQVHRYRSAAQIGADTTAGRATKAMAKHHALARRSIAAKHGRNSFDTLVKLTEGRPWLPALQ